MVSGELIIKLKTVRKTCCPQDMNALIYKQFDHLLPKVNIVTKPPHLFSVNSFIMHCFILHTQLNMAFFRNIHLQFRIVCNYKLILPP